MPKIKWNANAKITTLALGLKSDVDRASIPGYVHIGDTLDVSAEMLKSLQLVHPGMFEVVKATKKGESE